MASLFSVLLVFKVELICQWRWTGLFRFNIPELVVVLSHVFESHVAIFSAGLEAPFDLSPQGVVPD